MKISHKIILPMTIALGALTGCTHKDPRFLVVDREDNKLVMQTFDFDSEITTYVMDFDYESDRAISQDFYDVIRVGDTVDVYMGQNDRGPHVMSNTYMGGISRAAPRQRIQKINSEPAHRVVCGRISAGVRDSILKYMQDTTTVARGKTK